MPAGLQCLHQSFHLLLETPFLCSLDSFARSSLYSPLLHNWPKCHLGTTLLFVQLYDYLILHTPRYRLKQTGYKKIKSFKFFYDCFIRKILVSKDGDHTFFDVRMKASVKNTLYKVLVVLDSSGNVSNAACT